MKSQDFFSRKHQLLEDIEREICDQSICLYDNLKEEFKRRNHEINIELSILNSHRTREEIEEMRSKVEAIQNRYAEVEEEYNEGQSTT